MMKLTIESEFNFKFGFGMTEKEQFAALSGIRRGPYIAFNRVSAAQIWQWCSVMSEQQARYQTGSDQVAPLAMMQMWTMRDYYDRYAPGSTFDRPYQVFDDMAAMGYDSNVAVSYDIEFLRHLQVGEWPRHYTTIVNISDQKTTSLGVGYFVTERVEYTTDTAEVFAYANITYFQYRAKVLEPTTSGVTLNTDTAVDISTPVMLDPDSLALDWSCVTAGRSLAEWRLPITHRLVVGGALATQDFIPVHHNVPAARAAGMPDIFMNILTTSGLVCTYINACAGESGFIKNLKFSLMAPNMPGDVMTLQGQIQELTALDGAIEASIAFAGKNRMGMHTQGSAVVQVSK
ncbi:MAG: hypothetical protein P8O79_00080 [Halieaceae bacterium]|nr:hypothetical protein [Halieaceae bacterium]